MYLKPKVSIISHISQLEDAHQFQPSSTGLSAMAGPRSKPPHAEENQIESLHSRKHFPILGVSITRRFSQGGQRLPAAANYPQSRAAGLLSPRNQSWIGYSVPRALKGLAIPPSPTEPLRGSPTVWAPPPGGGLAASHDVVCHPREALHSGFLRVPFRSR